MPHVELYKYVYIVAGEMLQFNYYNIGPGNNSGLSCVDSMKIVDVLPDALTGINWGLRKDDDIKKIDCGRFSLGFDLDNEARSELGKSIDEFLATSELNYRKVYCVYQYGPDIAYEGWIDLPSIVRDKTHTEKKWDINFEVDGPTGHFFDSTEDVNVPKVPETGNVNFLEYFRDYHFGFWFNNGSVTQYIDEVKLQEKLGWPAEYPLISNPLQRSILYSDMSVFNATKSFVLGLGFTFELTSIRPNGYEAFHKLPFRMTISVEGERSDPIVVEDLLVHKQGYDWNANQHFILPWWKLSGQPAQIEAYYWGLFMSANAERIENHDFFNGFPIIQYNAGARKDLFEITGAGYFARVKDSYLLDMEYREQGLFTTTVLGENFGVAIPYCRVLVKRHYVENSQYRDTGYEDIVRVTAQEVYKYMCGQFKEKLFITVSYPEDTTIKPGSVLDIPDAGGAFKASKIKKIDAKKQEADLEVLQK